MTRYLYRHHGFIFSSNEPLGQLSEGPTGSTVDVAVEALTPGTLTARDLEWVMTDPPITMWRAYTEHGSCLRL
ncbi:MAG TPA: hypothetical protein VFI54_03065, partial [Solirubrobacteraceae bacterium]|nr:hypothetical protein [Solirubrobacteraceae bacterium]